MVNTPDGNPIGSRMRSATWKIASALGLALALLAAKSAPGAEDAKPGMVPNNPAPVLVELFTSEGCSDCPPADQLLTWLEAQQPIRGVQIIPLSEHVDYWNRQGWTDPFSSHVFSERQTDYSHSLHSDVYTPQMVVDGKAGFVGSEKIRALNAVYNEMHAQRATVGIQPVNAGTASGQSVASFSVEVENFPPLGKKKKGLVFFAVTEDNLSSNVSRGENAGHTLDNSAVVRELKMIGKVDARPDAVFHAQPSIDISKDWKRHDLHAVVFVQLEDSRRILGAAETQFPSP